MRGGLPAVKRRPRELDARRGSPERATCGRAHERGAVERPREGAGQLDRRGRRPCCETVANITVSVPDDVYNVARIREAEAHTSVSALVRDYLIRIASQGTEFERLLAQQESILNRVHERGAAYSATQRMTRDEVHDRDALR